MRNGRIRGFIILALLSVFVLGGVITSGFARAQTATSPNYQMTESEFTNTNGNDTCSDNYCTQVTVGDDGQSSSASSPEFGEVNYSEPLIEMIVTGGQSNLGDLSTEQPGKKTMSVKIRNYLSGGYRLMIVGDTPNYGTHNIKAMSQLDTSKPGTEQFGINVVANTTPSIGSNPIAQPSGTEDLSSLTADYKVANSYKYVPGDVIAETQTNTGGADYTVTMIINISNTTPAGHYSGDFSAIVVPYF